MRVVWLQNYDLQLNKELVFMHIWVAGKFLHLVELLLATPNNSRSLADFNTILACLDRHIYLYKLLFFVCWFFFKLPVYLILHLTFNSSCAR